MLKILPITMVLLVAITWLPAADAGQPIAQPSKELILDLGNRVRLKLVRIAPGKFLMGSPETEIGRENNEVQHEVTISKPFYMGVTPVTVDQFSAFASDSGYKTDAEKAGWATGLEIRDGKFRLKLHANGCSWRKPSFDQKTDHPVVQMSWNDATAFCDWLSKRSGKVVALPTEAQWEYSARAGTTTAYPWGQSPDAGKGWANCADQSLRTKLPNAPSTAKFFNWDDRFSFTSPVGSFKANRFGLYDMTGNTWQWCQDRYGGNYEKAAVIDPAGADKGDIRILRGGSWNTSMDNCRSAYRHGSNPDNRIEGNLDNFGFRVVVVGPGI